ncbi:MAG: hypothetical protein HY078_15085 [Elusimicrobia bacterium]|nr:hypothetical protein [Elusimicrobiota bacterium]
MKRRFAGAVLAAWIAGQSACPSLSYAALPKDPPVDDEADTSKTAVRPAAKKDKDKAPAAALEKDCPPADAKCRTARRTEAEAEVDESGKPVTLTLADARIAGGVIPRAVVLAERPELLGPAPSVRARMPRYAQAVTAPGTVYDGGLPGYTPSTDLRRPDEVRVPPVREGREPGALDEECPPSHPCGLRTAEPAALSKALRHLPFAAGNDEQTIQIMRHLSEAEVKNYDAHLRAVVTSSNATEWMKEAAIKALGRRAADDGVRAFLLEHGLKGGSKFETEDALTGYLNGLIPPSSYAHRADGLYPELKDNPDLRKWAKQAPEIVNRILEVSADSPGNSSFLHRTLNLLNYMNAADKLAFFREFKDPVRLMSILNVHGTVDVGERTGMHSDTAGVLYQRFLELSASEKRGLASVLAASPDHLRGDILDKLNRFGIIAKELEREAKDPKLHEGVRLLTALPKLMFETPNVDSRVLLSMFAAAMQGPRGKDFIATLVAAMPDNPRDIASLLELHKEKLSPDQRLAVARTLDEHPGAKQFLANYQNLPAIYGSDLWLRPGPRNFYVAMSQPEFLPQLEAGLRAAGIRLKSRTGAISEYTGVVNGKVVNYKVETFDTAGGWKNKKDVANALFNCMTDQSSHGCVYRGHATSWDRIDPRFVTTQFNGKAFFDGGCDSKANSWLMRNCPNCVGWWTTETAYGAKNTAFFTEGAKMLAAGQDFPTMNATYQRRMPGIVGAFTGHWSIGRAFAAATEREFDPPIPQIRRDRRNEGNGRDTRGERRAPAAPYADNPGCYRGIGPACPPSNVRIETGVERTRRRLMEDLHR